MKSNLYKSACVVALATAALSASPALADGTQAGEEITHTVTASYNVGGVSQTDETASDTFYVDRKINVVVATVGTPGNVPANSTAAVREFSVTNISNAAVGFALTTSVSGDFTLANIDIWIDSNGNDLLDSGESPITFLDSIAIDDTQNVKVRFDVPASANNGESVSLALVADAVEPGSGGATAIVATAGPNTAGTSASDIETVLADGAGAVDAANAGDFSAAFSVVAEAANLQLTKTSAVISDLTNGTTDPKAIPGAVVEYCIVASNLAGATVAGLVINDDFSPESANLTFLPDAYGAGADIVADGAGDCTGGTPVDKGYTTSTTTISQSLADLASGATGSVRYRVTIN